MNYLKLFDSICFKPVWIIQFFFGKEIIQFD